MKTKSHLRRAPFGCAAIMGAALMSGCALHSQLGLADAGALVSAPSKNPSSDNANANNGGGQDNPGGGGSGGGPNIPSGGGGGGGGGGGSAQKTAGMLAQTVDGRAKSAGDLVTGVAFTTDHVGGMLNDANAPQPIDNLLARTGGVLGWMGGNMNDMGDQLADHGAAGLPLAGSAAMAAINSLDQTTSNVAAIGVGRLGGGAAPIGVNVLATQPATGTLATVSVASAGGGALASVGTPVVGVGVLPSNGSLLAVTPADAGVGALGVGASGAGALLGAGLGGASGVGAGATTPVTSVVTPVVAPVVAPVVTPVVAPVAPVVAPTVGATVNGVLGLLHH